MTTKLGQTTMNPTGGVDGEDCIEMYPWNNGRWNDASCTYTYNEYVCMTTKLGQTTMKPTRTTTTKKTSTTTSKGTTRTTTRTTTTKSTPTQANGETTPVTTKKQGGMSGGGIAAIIISVCIVIGVSSVLVVMLKNRNWEVKRLIGSLNIENLRQSANNNNGTNMSSFANMSYNSNSGSVRASKS